MGITLRKTDAARSQLETAIRLFFEGGDPVSIHTLTCAAYDVLHDIGRPRGLEPHLKSGRWLRPRQREAYCDRLNRPRNFFKHADRDPESRLKFDPEITSFFLFDACEFFHQLTGEEPAAFDLFRLYFYVRYPQFVEEPSLAARVQALRRSAGIDRRDAWLSMLQQSRDALSP
jgi:hypothetical protein